jgi:hypothetical protein
VLGSGGDWGNRVCCRRAAAAGLRIDAEGELRVERDLQRGASQARRGKRREELQDGPSLVGPEVMSAWSSQSVGSLFDRIKSTMPADAPLTLGAAEVADIVAYVLSLNKCPAGDEDLVPDMTVLNRIHISARP